MWYQKQIINQCPSIHCYFCKPIKLSPPYITHRNWISEQTINCFCTDRKKSSKHAITCPVLHFCSGFSIFNYLSSVLCSVNIHFFSNALEWWIFDEHHSNYRWSLSKRVGSTIFSWTLIRKVFTAQWSTIKCVNVPNFGN